jgi:iron(III) transport system substrate-binding protein
MTMRRWKWLLPATLGLVLAGSAAHAQMPEGYPDGYAKIVEAAKTEGKLVIYGATDTAAAKFLTSDFEALYPGVKAEYSDMNTTEIYNRLISEKAAGGATADVTWSSSMDLQVKLAEEGYAETYKSPEAAKMPGWSVWKDMAYGTTYEPVTFVYNKRLITGDDAPKSRPDLVKLLQSKPDQFKGKITSYDIEKSGVGFLLITQDAKVNAGFWDFAKAIGAASPRFQSSSGTMMERISSGENLIGFNVLGGYARLRAKKDPSIGYLYPSDYTLVMSRVMFIVKDAHHPNAAKLWLDYILSKRGQTIIANQAELGAIRADVEGDMTAAGVAQTLGGTLKPIAVSDELLANLDTAKRLAFIKQWQGAVKGK